MFFRWVSAVSAKDKVNKQDLNYTPYGVGVLWFSGKIEQGEAGNDLLIGGGGYDQYVIAKGDGHDTIVNGFGMTRGELLINNESPNTLWFERVGSDLSVQVLGSDTQVKVQGWYDGSSPLSLAGINS